MNVITSMVDDVISRWQGVAGMVGCMQMRVDKIYANASVHWLMEDGFCRKNRWKVDGKDGIST